MKVMLINPAPLRDTLGPMQRFSPSIPPLSLVWPATFLKQQGFNVVVIDQHALGWSNSRLLAEIRIQKPDLIGFSCLTYVMQGIEDAVKRIRSQHPEVKIVLGGCHAAVFHRELVESALANFVIRSEGEEPLLALCRRLEQKKEPAGVAGVTWRTASNEVVVEPDYVPQLSFDLFPTPDWSFVSGIRYEAFRITEFDQGSLPAAVQATRGCKFSCSFCAQNLIYARFRERSPESVVRELRELFCKYGVRAFGFSDANFPPHREYALKFSWLMSKTGLSGSMRWFSEVRPDLLDYKTLQAMKKAGLRLIQLGIETGDPKVLQSMKKTKGWRDVEKIVDACKKLGILTVGLYVIGMPGETEDQIIRTIEYAVQLDTDLAKFSIATPYPGSGLWDLYRDFLKDEPWWKFSGWLDPARGGKHLLERVSLDSWKLAYLQRHAMQKFYGRPSKIARLFGSGLLRPSVLLQGIASVAQAKLDRLVRIVA